MGIKIALIVGVVIALTVISILIIDSVEAKKRKKVRTPLQSLKNFYLETTFPLTSPLTESQFRIIKQTLIYLVDYEKKQYERIPVLFDELTPDEIKEFARDARLKHLENHQKWRQFNHVFTRLRITDTSMMKELNHLMHKDAELVLRAWGVDIENSLEPLDTPVSPESYKEEDDEEWDDEFNEESQSVY